MAMSGYGYMTKCGYVAIHTKNNVWLCGYTYNQPLKPYPPPITVKTINVERLKALIKGLLQEANGELALAPPYTHTHNKAIWLTLFSLAPEGPNCRDMAIKLCEFPSFFTESNGYRCHIQCEPEDLLEYTQEQLDRLCENLVNVHSGCTVPGLELVKGIDLWPPYLVKFADYGCKIDISNCKEFFAYVNHFNGANKLVQDTDRLHLRREEYVTLTKGSLVYMATIKQNIWYKEVVLAAVSSVAVNTSQAFSMDFRTLWAALLAGETSWSLIGKGHGSIQYGNSCIEGATVVLENEAKDIIMVQKCHSAYDESGVVYEMQVPYGTKEARAWGNKNISLVGTQELVKHYIKGSKGHTMHADALIAFDGDKATSMAVIEGGKAMLLHGQATTADHWMINGYFLAVNLIAFPKSSLWVGGSNPAYIEVTDHFSIILQSRRYTEKDYLETIAPQLDPANIPNKK